MNVFYDATDNYTQSVFVASRDGVKRTDYDVVVDDNVAGGNRRTTTTRSIQGRADLSENPLLRDCERLVAQGSLEFDGFNVRPISKAKGSR